ncbi:nuclear transport factor 2 family protein [Hydrogenophaga sp.]|uniref:nuclear transport factor 2 family protein n=1 Tax=Hydrogenophaga sp. TaxID=1904254 RepID=UPI0027172DBA|nr:nuclear transport factor 2 family protein [Hydrogenophaga sp.]MDO9434625.1 nuclear transport factor 2 family protein [Hydrogenophaga sp.]
MSAGDRQDALQALLDKQAITEVFYRYARASDRGDLDLMRACFHPDAVRDEGHTRLLMTDYIDKWATLIVHPARVVTHSLSNVLIELDGDTASGEAHVLNFTRLKKDGEKFDTLTMSRFVDRFERRDGVWRIAVHRVAYDWNHEMPFAETWGRGLVAAAPEKLVRGRRKPDDLLYRATEP